MNTSDEPLIARDYVCVRVPATTANMGPGFDCLGMALDVWNELTVERSDEFLITIEGEGTDNIPKDSTNLVCSGLAYAFKAAGKDVPILKYHLKNRIPFCRGLGSSSAAIIAGLVAGLVLSGHELPVKGSEELLQLACEIEGHPDNVAPALYGGLQIGIHTGSRWYTSRVSTPYGMQCVVFVPDFTTGTKESRQMLKDMVPMTDAVFNIGHTAMMINAFTTGNFAELKYAAQDKLHQPIRGTVLKHLDPLIEASVAAGAHACFLSGSGSSVLAITSGAKGDIYSQKNNERMERKVADSMIAAAKAIGVTGRVFLTNPTTIGAHVVAARPAFSTSSISAFTPLGTT